jgi:hypothetical protein
MLCFGPFVRSRSSVVGTQKLVNFCLGKKNYLNYSYRRPNNHQPVAASYGKVVRSANSQAGKTLDLLEVQRMNTILDGISVITYVFFEVMWVRFFFNGEPNPAFYLSADPDTDPDPGQTLPSLKFEPNLTYGT